MSRHLTEPEAWREIARRLAERECRHGGLCHQIARLHYESRIVEETRYAMHVRLKVSLGTDDWTYRIGTVSKARILFALWLALEAKGETPCAPGTLLRRQR